MVLPESARLPRMLRYIGWPLALLLVWDVLVTLAYVYLPHPEFELPILPMTLLGSALALFLGFRNNNAYNRWWEARTLWGAMVNASRSYGRAVIHLIDKRPESHDLRHALVMRQVAYVNALRCHLRRQPALEEIRPFLGEGEAEGLKSAANVPNVILNETAALLSDAMRQGWMDSIRRTQIEQLLVDMSNAQGGMERIKNTPLPREYAYFPTLFVQVFCILLPVGLVDSLGIYTPLASTIVGFMMLAMDRIGGDLQDPFENRAHDVPLTSICRTIQIDLEQLCGEPDVPPPVRPVNHVLW
ncbi:bestrophin family protein [Aureimonas sp. N4]|uniref:bestrophin family protein n=1 Tax=Aureimonas sp. N4 TaxID=1638165 RepID=UPI00078573B0|nr:bestrophin family ion channel [Aureimonas sp. N4]